MEIKERASEGHGQNEWIKKCIKLKFTKGTTQYEQNVYKYMYTYFFAKMVS